MYFQVPRYSDGQACMGGATIVIGGYNVPPNTHECGGQGGTKIIGDSVPYTCMKELGRGNSNSENYFKNAYSMSTTISS